MDTPGTLIGRYEIVRRLGRGGMGSVYLARHRDLDRSVALKVLRESVDDQMLRERFAREARSVARLDHPNIVRVYDFGYHDEQPYLAMEYVPGDTLADRLRPRAPLPVADVLRWMEQLCAALEHAHASNIVHRDVKPPNLIISPDGVLKVLDFGIARMAGSTLTDAGLMVGTLNYMSPEQIEGRPVDHRTDIFSAGLVLYEALTGRQAFPGTMQDGVLNAVLKGSPPPVYELQPRLPAGIGAIVTKAIQKRSANRYQDFGEFARAIRQIRDGSETSSASAEDGIDTLRVTGPPVSTPVEEPPAAPTELVLQALSGKDAMRDQGATSTLAYATTVIRRDRRPRPPCRSRSSPRSRSFSSACSRRLGPQPIPCRRRRRRRGKPSSRRGRNPKIPSHASSPLKRRRCRLRRRRASCSWTRRPGPR